jgi:hypothetical protein
MMPIGCPLTSLPLAVTSPWRCLAVLTSSPIDDIVNVDMINNHLIIA